MNVAPGLTCYTKRDRPVTQYVRRPAEQNEMCFTENINDSF